MDLNVPESTCRDSLGSFQTFGVITKEMNPEELTATWSQRMFMLLLPWRHGLLISVMQYKFEYHWSVVERKNSAMIETPTFNLFGAAAS